MSTAYFGLSAEQERVLKLLEAERGTWRTPREIGAHGRTLFSLHKLGIVERHEIGPDWHCYRVPPEPQ